MDYNAIIEGVQYRLSQLGYYVGEIDGLYGPMTKAALIAFKTRHGLLAREAPLLITLPLIFSKEAKPSPTMDTTAGGDITTVPPLLTVMRGLVGLQESPGTANNPRIQDLAKKAGLSDNWQDADPWCAVAVNGALVEAGYPGTKSALAQSFRQYGQQVRREDVQRGDIIVMPRGDVSWQGHVEVVDVVHQDGTVTAIGANVSNTVKRTRRDLDNLFSDGIRRPVKSV